MGVAGCASRSSERGSDQTQSAPPTGTVAGQSLPVPESDLTRALPRDGIRAIVDPAFGEDWGGVKIEVMGPQGFMQTRAPRLAPDDRVIGVERDGRARAYPLSVLRWHEIVNDDFGGPLLVTYCPLCRSAVTAERRAGDTVTTFGVSGLLWRDNLVLYDAATDTKWSQFTATAIRGPLTGTDLSLTPSTVTTWESWRADYPDTQVLRPPPESKTLVNTVPRNYPLNGYQWYAETDSVGVDGDRLADDRLHPKALVAGVESGADSRAFPYETVADAGVVTDTVGSLPVVVTAGPADTMQAFVRRVGGKTVTVERDGEYLVADGSRWHPRTGRAVDGRHDGARLARATALPPLYWFAWLASHPETTVYGAQ